MSPGRISYLFAISSRALFISSIISLCEGNFFSPKEKRIKNRSVNYFRMGNTPDDHDHTVENSKNYRVSDEITKCIQSHHY